jgi:hypothetical protein
VRSHILALEQAARDFDIPMHQIFMEAKIADSTWTRWKNGGDPRLSKWLTVVEAMHHLVAEKTGERQDIGLDIRPPVRP